MNSLKPNLAHFFCSITHHFIVLVLLYGELHFDRFLCFSQMFDKCRHVGRCIVNQP